MRQQFESGNSKNIPKAGIAKAGIPKAGIPKAGILKVKTPHWGRSRDRAREDSKGKSSEARDSGSGQIQGPLNSNTR